MPRGRRFLFGDDPLGDQGAVELEVTTDERGYEFGAPAGRQRCKLGRFEARALSAESVMTQSYFRGAYFALYATGLGRAATAPADFDWFEYKVVE